MESRREGAQGGDFPHDHWFVTGRNGEQCVYCGQSPDDAKGEAHENG